MKKSKYVYVNTKLYLQNTETSDCVPAALVSALNTLGQVHDWDVDWYFRKLKRSLGTTQAGTSLEAVRPALKNYAVNVRRIPFNSKAVTRVLERGGLVLVAYDSAPGEGHVGLICGLSSGVRGIEYYSLADPLYGLFSVPVKMLEANAKISGFWCRSIEKETPK